MYKFRIIVEALSGDPNIKTSPIGGTFEASRPDIAIEMLLTELRKDPMENPKIRAAVNDLVVEDVNEQLGPDENWSTREEDQRTFLSLDQPTRALILRLLSDPSDADWEELGKHPNSRKLTEWLFSQPAYQRAAEGDDEDEDEGPVG